MARVHIARDSGLGARVDLAATLPRHSHAVKLMLHRRGACGTVGRRRRHSPGCRSCDPGLDDQALKLGKKDGKASAHIFYFFV